MGDLMQRYFAGGISSDDLHHKLARNKEPYFLSDEDVASAAVSALKAFGDTLKRPYPSNALPLIKDFIKVLGISYSIINANGDMDALGMKMFQGYVVDFFAKGVPLSQIQISTSSVTSVLPLSTQKKSEAYLNVLNKAAGKFMADGWLSDAEQSQIEAYTSGLGLSLNNIPAAYQSEAVQKISQAIILKELQKGIMPKTPLTIPVMLGRGETTIWVHHGVTMFREKITREYQGGSRGYSYRICKGLTYRTGSFKGKPVERSSMESVGTGELVITNKHLFFHCPTTSVKIPFSKLIGITPYSDGLEVHKEEAKPKRIVFQGFDSWFVMNVLNLVNNI